jgi:hypothetical protein
VERTGKASKKRPFLSFPNYFQTPLNGILMPFRRTVSSTGEHHLNLILREEAFHGKVPVFNDSPDLGRLGIGYGLSGSMEPKKIVVPGAQNPGNRHKS